MAAARERLRNSSHYAQYADIPQDVLNIEINYVKNARLAEEATNSSSSPSRKKIAMDALRSNIERTISENGGLGALNSKQQLLLRNDVCTTEAVEAYNRAYNDLDRMPTDEEFLKIIGGKCLPLAHKFSVCCGIILNNKETL
ncbi:MAG: hypothetical protein LE180_04300 [Endomicrobium sp.]|uniref:hypothetical protein n=1 Tax=Candidatus Endomicrobiellum pyrsonymphae TaxID=1408203 RepID=UPI0035750B5A|nr:hypothetical protein [Endomicrobium sp.]